jgi:Flp pilus assembly pilin Flp
MIETHLISRSRSTRPAGNAKGQTLAEYALVLAFISIVTISALAATSGQVKGVFTTVAVQIALAENGGPPPTPPPRPQ